MNTYQMDTTSNEAELRAWAEKKLSCAVPDHIWRWLREDGNTRIVEPDDRTALVERARTMLARDGESVAKLRDGVTTPEGQRHPRGNHEVKLAGYSQARAETLSHAIAALAASIPDVREFRGAVLGGVLTPEDARGFVKSPAVRYLSRDHFATYGTPFVGHEARFLERRIERGLQGLDYETLTILVHPPGAGVVRWHGSNRLEELHFMLDLPQAMDEPRWGKPFTIDLATWAPWGNHPLETIEDAVLDELRQLSAWLAEIYPWSAADAAWFVLTGTEPFLPPVTWTGYSNPEADHYRASITLTVDAWVQPREVAHAYRQAQARVVGRRVRSMSRGIELVRFVQQESAGRKRPPWRTLVERWNHTHPPEQHYDGEAEVRRFWRDHKRAEQALLFPNYEAFVTLPRRQVYRPFWNRKERDARRVEDHRAREGASVP